MSACRTQDRTDSVPYPSWVDDALDRAVLGSQLGTQRLDHPHRSGLLIGAVATCRRLPGVVSFGMSPSSFPNEGDSNQPSALHDESGQPLDAVDAGEPDLRWAIGIRTDRYLYVDLASGKEELYDLATDPNQYHNLAVTPTPAEAVACVH